MQDFYIIWNNIIANEGNTFYTISGKEFTYRINGNFLITDRTERNIPKNDIEKAFNSLPLNGPSEINNLVQGPSYVWAILNDNRINKRMDLTKE
ncbi:MAG: hypothetical protein LBB89_03175 [Treponema sp.]|jgi:hypothetical protein|nr:hypothetical protein [Treponema sp.]